MEKDSKKIGKLPSVRRLVGYLNMLRRHQEAGRQQVSTTLLSEEAGLEPIVVRKDLEITGISGQPGVGYQTDALIGAIEKFLGWSESSDAFLIGAGSLGRALMGYKGFAAHGFKVLAAFDSDPSKECLEYHGIKVFPMRKLVNLAGRLKVRLAILCVPEEAAQECAELLVRAGMKGIWNFSPVNLRVPDSVVVQNEDLASSLAVLSFKLSRRMKNTE